MSECKSAAKSVECSDRETDPEMFLVNGKRVECLAHAIVSESKGRDVKIILT